MENAAGTVSARPDGEVHRRRIIEYLLGGGLLASAASFLYPLARDLVPPPVPDLGTDTVVAARVGDLKPNSGRIFRFGNRPGLLVLTPDGEYRAMAATCTHLDCTVQYRGDLQQVWCACHNGFYDLNGRNIAGPPPRPLESYEARVRGDEVVVSKRQS
jgi:Rieske Fe-S protein